MVLKFLDTETWDWRAAVEEFRQRVAVGQPPRILGFAAGDRQKNPSATTLRV